MLLCYWVWLKKDTYWTRGDKQAKEGAREAIRTMLSRLIELWPCSTGQGWERPKVHKQLHVPDDIERNGCPQGSHSGPTEHNHIALIKKQAKGTLKRRSNLDWQIANRTSETYIINSAFSRMSSSFSTEDVNQDEIKQFIPKKLRMGSSKLL